MALMLVIQHWRPYLQGQKFVVYIDKICMRYLLEQCITTQNQHNWLDKLLGYDFQIVYRSGKSNKVAYALSRKLEDQDEEEIKLWDFKTFSLGFSGYFGRSIARTRFAKDQS